MCIDGHFDILEHDFLKFVPRTNDRLLEIQQLLISANARVESGNMIKKAYDNLEMGLGFNRNAEGLVCDEALFSVVNFAEIWRTDWVHDELQSSVVQRELKCFLAACERVEIKKDAFGQLLAATWCFPHHLKVKHTNLVELFQKKRKQVMAIKFGLRLLIPETSLAHVPEVENERKSFEACCRVIDLYLEAKQCDGNNVESIAAELQVAQAEHHALHLAAYGADDILPKHHMRGHVGRQLLTDKILIDMFVVERLNLRLRNVAEALSNTGTFEKSIMCSLLTKHLTQLTDTRSLVPGLIGPTSTFDDHDDLSLGRAVSLRGQVIYIDDIVVVADSAYRVTACVQERGAMYVIVRLMRRIGGTPNSGAYDLTETLRVLAVEDVRTATAWYLNSHGHYVVLHR